MAAETLWSRAPWTWGETRIKPDPFPCPLATSALCPPHTVRAPEPPRPPEPERAPAPLRGHPGGATAAPPARSGAAVPAGARAPLGPHGDSRSRRHTRYLGEPAALPQGAGRSRGSSGIPRAFGAGHNQRGSRPRRVGAPAAPAEGPCEAPPRAGQSSAPQPLQHSPGPRSAAAAPLPLRVRSRRRRRLLFAERGLPGPSGYGRRRRPLAGAAATCALPERLPRAHWPPPVGCGRVALWEL